MSTHQHHDGAETVGVCLVGCTGLLGDIIVDAVRRDPQIALVFRVDSGSELQHPADRHALNEVDLVVWKCDDEFEVREWLDGVRSDPRVLAVVEDGHNAALWEFAPQRTSLGPLSPARLTEVIRTGALMPAPDPIEPRTDQREKTWPRS